MFEDVILNYRSFILNNDFFQRIFVQSLDVDGWPSLLQFKEKEGLQQVLLAIFLVSTVVAERDFRAVFGKCPNC